MELWPGLIFNVGQLKEYAMGREPWKCEACGKMICYLKEGYPVNEAPEPHFVSIDYRNVCTLCYQVAITLDSSNYWRNLHSLWLKKKNTKNDPAAPTSSD